jgi:group I intron endonuclease
MEIYLVTNTLNSKIYVGQSTKNDPNYLGSGTLISKAIKKYGRQHFKKEILEIVENEDLLDEREIFWIAEFQQKGYQLYNLQEGGRGWSKKVLDEYWKKRRKDEHQALLEKMRSVEQNYECTPVKGYTRRPIAPLVSDDKVCESKLAKKVYKFSKDGELLKVYNSLLEAFISHPQMKSKGNLSSACKGMRNYVGGYRWSYTETPHELKLVIPGRKKGSKDTKKRKTCHSVSITYTIEQYDLDKKLLKIWSTPSEASNILNISRQCLIRACNTELPYKGFLWKKGERNIITQYKD